MNNSRVLNIPIRKLAIVASVLFVVGGFASLITVAWLLIQFPLVQAPSHVDPWNVVDDLHIAINNNNADQVLTLFANSATIADNDTVINGKDKIRNWVLYSKRMSELHLKMFRSEVDGEKFIWLDSAHNGPEGQNRYYILRWEAVIADGKIQSLAVFPRYMPDLK